MEDLEPLYIVVGMQNGTAAMENSMKVLKKLKIELLYDPAILLLSIYLKVLSSRSQRDICAPMFIAALFTIAKIWKQPKSPRTDE